MKTCTRCKCEKELDAFARSNRSKDGRLTWCKECKNKWYAENAEKQRLLQRLKRKGVTTPKRYRKARTFADAVYMARKAKHMSRQQVADMVGCGMNTIERIETRSNDVARTTCIAVVQTLGLPPSVMMLP